MVPSIYMVRKGSDVMHQLIKMFAVFICFSVSGSIAAGQTVKTVYNVSAAQTSGGRPGFVQPTQGLNGMLYLTATNTLTVN